MAKVNIDKIAKKLGATRRGAVEARSGYFGAMELLAEVQRRFQVPPTGVELRTLRSRFDARSRCKSGRSSASSR